ncbi:hypothetical protein BDD12DRAFT_839813 [Trichophaea hybrida]|nr:hypothetical protein BDD12DRAFT_839813 [Trichophaea hybrida]
MVSYPSIKKRTHAQFPSYANPKRGEIKEDTIQKLRLVVVMTEKTIQYTKCTRKQ